MNHLSLYRKHIAHLLLSSKEKLHGFDFWKGGLCWMRKYAKWFYSPTVFILIYH